jgi:hypothetical protein
MVHLLAFFDEVFLISLVSFVLMITNYLKKTKWSLEIESMTLPLNSHPTLN